MEGSPCETHIYDQSSMTTQRINSDVRSRHSIYAILVDSHSISYNRTQFKIHTYLEDFDMRDLSKEGVGPSRCSHSDLRTTAPGDVGFNGISLASSAFVVVSLPPGNIRLDSIGFGSRIFVRVSLAPGGIRLNCSRVRRKEFAIVVCVVVSSIQ